MKRNLIVLLFLIMPCFAFASSSYEPITIGENNSAYSFMDISMGYGYTFLSGTSAGTINSHALEIAFDTGHVSSSSSFFQIGWALRMDLLLDLTEGMADESALNILIGPLMVFNLNKLVNLNLTVGPSFNALTFKNFHIFSLAPALDVNVEIEATESLTFKAGCALCGQIGVTERAFGLSVSPYLSASYRFAATSARGTSPPPPRNSNRRVKR